MTRPLSEAELDALLGVEVGGVDEPVFEAGFAAEIGLGEWRAIVG